MYSSDDDSELNYELEEEEIKLYTQLYFGDEYTCVNGEPGSQNGSFKTQLSEPSHGIDNPLPKSRLPSLCDNINNTNTVRQQAKPSNDHNIDNQHAGIYGASSCDNKANRVPVCYNGPPLNHTNNNTTTDCHGSTTNFCNYTKKKQEPMVPVCMLKKAKTSEIVPGINTTVFVADKNKSESTTNNKVMNSKKRKGSEVPPQRKRNISQCSSIDSISGREPLDSLYCNDAFYEKDMLDIIQEASISSLNDSRSTFIPDRDSSDNEEQFEDNFSTTKSLIKKSNNRFNDSSDDELSKYNIGKTKRCTKNLHKPSSIGSHDSSSDEEAEVSILSPPSPKRVDTMDGGSISDSDQSIIILEAVEKKQILYKPKKKKEMAIVLSSSGSSSDEFSVDGPLSTHLSSPLILNLDSKKIFVSKHQAIKLVKSQVIFSNARSLTKRTPSCPTWTQEMASMYDSDYSDVFSVKDVHKSQSDSVNKWKICPEDYPRNRGRRQRYFEKRCVRCKQDDHLVKNCPRVPHCLYCGSDKHTYIPKCPHNCCLRCGGPPHGYCLSTTPQKVCQECGSRGHIASVCPDLWRRFHATTSGSVPARPIMDASRTPRKRTPYCYNCAKAGHYGHECQLNNTRKYALVSTQIFSYRRPHADAAPSTPRQSAGAKHPRNAVDEHQSLAVDEPRQGAQCIRRVVTVRRREAERLLQDEKVLLKEIQARSGTAITCRLRGKIGDVQLMGSEAAIKNAEYMVRVAKRKRPRKLYFDLVHDALARADKEGEGEKEGITVASAPEEDTRKAATPRRRSPLPPALSSFPSPYLSACKEKKALSPPKGAPNPISATSLKVAKKIKMVLKVPLPSRRLLALRALSKVMRKRPSWIGPTAKVRRFNQHLKFFDNPPLLSSSPGGRKKRFTSELQLLSLLLLHSQSNSWIKQLRAYKTRLENSPANVIDAQLHAEVSHVYLNVADPPLKNLPSMLTMARGIVESLKKKIGRRKKKKKMTKEEEEEENKKKVENKKKKKAARNKKKKKSLKKARTKKTEGKKTKS